VYKLTGDEPVWTGVNPETVKQAGLDLRDRCADDTRRYFEKQKAEEAAGQNRPEVIAAYDREMQRRLGESDEVTVVCVDRGQHFVDAFDVVEQRLRRIVRRELDE
jgi:hypothetical protein